jgi:tetratricopeptide (TPR) repeat protein
MRSSRSARHLFALLIALAIVAPAETWARPPSAKERAKTLFKAGKAAYAKKDFKEAAAKFTAAYELDPQPASLLNIAQSYRSADDYGMAARYYQKYLEAAPGSPLKAQVEELLREARSKLEKPKPAPDLTPRPDPAPATSPALVTPQPEPEPAPSPSRPLYKRWWFWTAIAAVVVGTSVGVGVYAGTREPDYVKEGGLGSVRW